MSDSTSEGCIFSSKTNTITSDEGGNPMDLIKIGKYIAGKRKELGISINEFLAGEDIAQENIVKNLKKTS